LGSCFATLTVWLDQTRERQILYGATGIAMLVALPIAVLAFTFYQLRKMGGRNGLTAIAALCTVILVATTIFVAVGVVSGGKEFTIGHLKLAQTALALALTALGAGIISAITMLACMLRRKRGWVTIFALMTAVFLLQCLFLVQGIMQA